MGFDFTLIAPLLPSHCVFSFVLGHGVSSLVKSRVFLSMIVQQPVVILELSQEGVSARLENILDEKNIDWSCLTYSNYEKIISTWGNTLTKLIANMFMKMKIIECFLLSLANQLFCYHWLMHCTKKEHKIKIKVNIIENIV